MTEHRTHIAMRNTHRESLPPEFVSDDVRFPEEFVELLVDRYSAPGDVVLDPFAGFGTVVEVAERMGRVAYGLEIDERRAEYARTRLRSPERLLTADVRRITSLGLPPVDLSLSSPPYMQRSDTEDPLSGYVEPGAGYERYVSDLSGVYASLQDVLKPSATLVIEVANLKRDGVVTTLAWDLAAELSRTFVFEGETVVAWDRYGYGYDHSYCLVFKPDA